MRLLVLGLTIVVVLRAAAETLARKLWTELQAKRGTLPGIHKEFDVSETFKTVNGSRSSKRQLIIDVTQGLWRERTVTGSENHINIFDGKDFFWMEEGGSEYPDEKPIQR